MISLGIGDPDAPSAADLTRRCNAPPPTRARTSTRRTAAGRSSARPPRSTSAASGSRSTRRPRSFRRSAPRSASSTSTWRSSTRATSPWRQTPATRSTPAGRCSRGAGADAQARARVRPDLGAIEPDVREKARLMYLNYPNNPTGRSRPTACSRRRSSSADVLIARRARRVVHGDDVRRLRRPELATDGAKDVGVEVFSLSKGYNMTGWRTAAIGERGGDRGVLAAEDEHRLRGVRRGPAGGRSDPGAGRRLRARHVGRLPAPRDLVCDAFERSAWT